MIGGVSMFATDFQYDGQYLSDYNCTICTTRNTSEITYISAGYQITFNTISRNRGKQRSWIGSQYDSCIQTTFDIYKDTGNLNRYGGTYCNVEYFTIDEVRDLMVWLNREDFHKFRFVMNDGSEVFYYNASFNVEKIEKNNNVIGLRLTMFTDKPYAYGSDVQTKIEVTRTQLSKQFNVYSKSDFIGDIIPDVKITCAASGDISIANLTNGSTMTIKGCTKNEVITINGDRMTLTSSTGRNLYNSFNYEFLKLTNSFTNGSNNFRNVITISLPSTVEITYTPIVKYGA